MRALGSWGFRVQGVGFRIQGADCRRAVLSALAHAHIAPHPVCLARNSGKSGPLFHFDVHDDIRTVNDARIEKDESHAGELDGVWERCAWEWWW